MPSTKLTNWCEVPTMQAEMKPIASPKSADENNARLDRLFERLYRLRGNDLRGLSDEIEKDSEPKRESTDESRI